MKKFILILSIYLFSCELGDLQENTGMLSGSYYINQAWDYFQIQDYSTAEELFVAPLDGDNRDYDKLAYVGLGWTMIYKSNMDLSIGNKSNRETMRSMSEQYFNNALSIHNNEESLDSSTVSELDILYSGLAFSNSYTAFRWQEEYFSQGLEEQYWDSVKVYSNKVIDFADMISTNEFIFPYDESLDYNVIRFLKAQTYLRLNDIVNALKELNQLDSCQQCTQEDIYTCIDSCYYN